MLPITPLRELSVHEPSAPGRPRHLSAASGLVREGDVLYVVADDENHLGRFTLDHAAPGELMRLFEGTLPDEYKPRKKAKADLEILLRLPASEGFPHGALLALGSGSKPQRRRGALLPLDAESRPASVREIDLSGLYEALGERFEGLNLEGGVVIGEELHLLQRGNKKDQINARIRLALPAVLRDLRQGRLQAMEPIEVRRYPLGHIGDVPLCFTDAAALPDGALIFSAVAENTEDSYNDGPCAGAAVGVIDARGELGWLERLDPGPDGSVPKIEGIETCPGRGDGLVRLLMVTDADDADVPARLYSARIGWRGR